LSRRKEGETVTIAIGGTADSRMGGGSLNVTSCLKRLSDGDYIGNGPMIRGLKYSWGPTAVLAGGGLDILVVTTRSQIYDQHQFKSFGADPAGKAALALKSMQHFRAAVEPFAAWVIVCNSGALCTHDLRKLPFRSVPRPILPLDLESNGGYAEGDFSEFGIK
jgi:microcystin degradation protein MlrC